MVVFFLSACPNFSKGYAAILGEYIQGVIPVYFDSIDGLLSHRVMKPDLIFMKEEGIPETRKVLKSLGGVFPEVLKAIAYYPNPKRIRFITATECTYYFPLNEPEDTTMNQIKTKLVMRQVNFSVKEHPVYGEANELFAKYLLLKPNLAICFSHIYARKTAVEIGDILHVSARTVEGYISRLKKVFDCQSKKDLEKVYGRLSHLSNTMTQDHFNGD